MSIPVSTLTGSNTINQMMYNVNTIKDLAANSAGFVESPGSSTDNAVMRFDGTSGRLAQDSSVLIADDGSMIISGSSSGDMLRITQTGAGNALLVEDSTNPDSTPFVVDADGNVGIGTSSPGAALDVNKGYIALSGAGTDNRSIEIGVGRTGNGLSFIDLIGDTTYSDYGVRFIRYDTGPNTTSELQHRGTGPFVINAFDAGSVQLKTSNAERMRIDSSGNVGIGTTSPSGKLHVYSGSAGAVTASTLGDDFVIENTDNMGMSLLTNDTGSGYIFWGSPSDNDAAFIRGAYNSGSPYLALGISGAERARIDSNGKVGIGTTSPSYRFQIAAGTDSLITYAASVLNNNIYFDTQNTSTGALAAVVQRLITSDVAGTGSTSADFQKTKAGALNINNYETDSAAYTAFGVGAAERMRITAAGNVGIGTTTPDGTLHAHTASAGSVTAWVDADELTVENSGQSGITILSPDTSDSTLSFGSPTAVPGAYLRWRYDFKRLLIGTNVASGYTVFLTGAGAEGMRLDSSGRLGIGRTPTTNLLEVAGTIESTSGGFKFPDGSTQTTSASALGITTGKAIAMAIVFG